MSQSNNSSIRDVEGNAAEKVIIHMRDKALAGCIDSACFIVNLLPKAVVESYVEVDILDSVKTIEDVNNAMTEVLNQAGKAEISLDDALKIMDLLSIKGKTLHDLKSK